MNRQQRRAFDRALKRNALKHPVPKSVVLRGGPMDGWVVTPDAPALQAGWYMTWPPTVAARQAPGRYGAPIADARGVQRATWQAL